MGEGRAARAVAPRGLQQRGWRAAFDRRAAVALDGVLYRLDEHGAVFHPRGEGPTAAELQQLVRKLSAAVPASARPCTVVPEPSPGRAPSGPSRRRRTSRRDGFAR
jgi:hypothetical protein